MNGPIYILSQNIAEEMYVTISHLRRGHRHRVLYPFNLKGNVPSVYQQHANNLPKENILTTELLSVKVWTSASTLVQILSIILELFNESWAGHFIEILMLIIRKSPHDTDVKHYIFLAITVSAL